MRPTMRAADGGWAARFLAIFAALGFLRLDEESKLQPTAANACRWHAHCTLKISQNLGISDV